MEWAGNEAVDYPPQGLAMKAPFQVGNKLCIKIYVHCSALNCPVCSCIRNFLLVGPEHQASRSRLILINIRIRIIKLDS